MAPARSDPLLGLSVLSWNVVGYALLPICFNSKYLQSSQQTELDIHTIELLAPQIKMLSESLSAPIPLGDINEKERGGKLEQ